YDHVFIPGILWQLRTAVHGEPLRLRQEDIILKDRINERGNIFRRSPPGGAVLHALPIFLRIFASDVNYRFHQQSAHHANTEILWMEAGKDVLERQGKIQEKY